MKVETKEELKIRLFETENNLREVQTKIKDEITALWITVKNLEQGINTEISGLNSESELVKRQIKVNNLISDLEDVMNIYRKIG